LIDKDALVQMKCPNCGKHHLNTLGHLMAHWQEAFRCDGGCGVLMRLERQEVLVIGWLIEALGGLGSAGGFALFGRADSFTRKKLPNQALNAVQCSLLLTLYGRLSVSFADSS
jgi:hypothetical protein